MFQIVEVNVEEVMTFYERELRRNSKSKKKSKVRIETDHELEQDSASDIIKTIHKHRNKPKHARIQIEESANDEEISADVDEMRDSLVKQPDIPTEIPAHQLLTIKLNKKSFNDTKNISELKTVAAVIEHHDSRPTIEISAHHKHGHVRQH